MNKRLVGSGFEQEAAEFLRGQGFQIRQVNFRSRFGEIDIVAMEGRTLVFAEVKYRADSKAGLPWEAVDRRKQYRICRTADYYMIRYGFTDNVPVRFDVVAILGGEITLFRNAFFYLPNG